MTLDPPARAKVDAGREPAPALPPSRQGGPAANRARGERPALPTIPELGGPKGPEPTRYGDWERNGIASDF